MVSVQRYSIEPPTAVGAPYEHGEWVRFTDHEAALAAFARHEGCDEVGRCEGYDEGWNAALEAVAAYMSAQHPEEFCDLFDNTRRYIAALRKPTPQPEPPCECWLCHDINLPCDKCENCIVQATPQPEALTEHAGIGMNAGGSIYPVPEGRYAKAAREGRERREQQAFSPEAKSEPAAAQPEGGDDA